MAEKLNTAAPISAECRTIFVTTGAEAVENSIKIARAHTGRRGVIAFQGGFHGRTNLTMGLTGKVMPYKKSFGPFPAEIYHAPFPMKYHGVSVVLEVIAEERLVERAHEIGQRFMDHLSKLQQQFPDQVGDIRNRGAMIAMELVRKGDANQPDAALTKALVVAAADKGLILLSCGTHGNVIRFLPPLTIPMGLVDEGMEMVADCFASFQQPANPPAQRTV